MSFPWTDDNIAHLRTRWTVDGASAASIASELGTTRNSVIAKVHRLGFRQASKAPPTPKPKPIKPTRNRVIRPKQTVENSVMKDDCFNAFARPTVELMQLEIGMCRWPYGERPFRYCGERTINPFDPECPYCVGHARLAYSGSVSLVEDREDVKEAA